MKSKQYTREYIDSLVFYTPPVCAGQIIEYSYAMGDGELILMVQDYSDGSVRFESNKAPDVFEPWNKIPNFERMTSIDIEIVG